MQVSQQGLHMTLKATIKLMNSDSPIYDHYFTVEGGVIVGPAGELQLVASHNCDPLEFRIYAPGTWKEVNVFPVSEE